MPCAGISLERRPCLTGLKGHPLRNSGLEDTPASRNPKQPSGGRGMVIESLRVNTSLIRRRIRSPNLWIEHTTGSLTRTEVAVAYIKGLAGEEILEECGRVFSGDLDSILGSGYIEEMIRIILFPSCPPSIGQSVQTGLPQHSWRACSYFYRRDFACAHRPDGFSHVLQAPDDYEVFLLAAFFEFCAIFPLLSLFLPGIYVAVLNYHVELVPTSLLLRIQATREGSFSCHGRGHSHGGCL